MDRKKILIVDDEPAFVEMVKLRLEANGYDVITANDGEQALEKVKEDPDLLLIDIMMPKIDGYTLLRELRADNSTRTLPVIVVSAKPDLKDLFQIEGVHHYIVKPIETDEFLSTIREVLEENDG